MSNNSQNSQVPKIKSNFISIDYGRSLLNLDNVSNIAFLERSNRIVFNFVSNIEIKSKNGIQVIADYRYDDYVSLSDYNNRKYELQDILSDLGFIAPKFEGHHWINPKHVTFVNVDKKRNKVMFNLANSVTKMIDNEVMLVNDFVFWTHKSEEDTKQSVQYVFDILSK
jgi:hypothetical protein